MADQGVNNMTEVRLNKSWTVGTFVEDTKNFSYEESDVVLLGVACDLTASYNKGAWHGPHAIIDASYQVEFEAPAFHTPLTTAVKIHNEGILECPPSVDNNGNLIDYSHEQIAHWMNQMVAETEQIATQVFRDNKLLMLFGGDHSVPNGVWKAMAKLYPPKDVAVLHFDGHLDLRDELRGFTYSHACIMRRARDHGFRVIQAGPRDHISREEAEYIKPFTDDIFLCATQPEEFYNDVKTTGEVTQHNLIRNGNLTEEQLKRIEEKVSTAKYLWISIDVDGLDASHIPGTGTPLPMGLTRETLHRTIYRAIRAAKMRGVKILGFDINEVAPQLKKEAPYSALNTVSTLTEMHAALLAYDILLWTYLERFNK